MNADRGSTLGQESRPTKGSQGGSSNSAMDERISWLIAQGKVMLDFYRKATIPGEKGQIKTELASLYRQLTQVTPVLTNQRRYKELLTLQQIQLEIAKILGGKRAEGVIMANIGSTYLTLRQYQKALEGLEEALPLLEATDNKIILCTTLHNLGEACRLLRRYKDALEWYDEALSIDPDRSTCWFVKGDVLERMGRLDEAIASYKQSLQLRPDFKPTQEALRRLGVSS